MIILKKYEIEDWVKIDDAVEPLVYMESSDDFNEVVQRGIAVTAIEDGVVMSCGGIAYVNEKEGIVWVRVSRKCLRQSFRWARTILEAFRIMTDSIGDLHISTYVLGDFPKGDKLARMIGLYKTGETERYKRNTYYKYTAVA